MYKKTGFLYIWYLMCTKKTNNLCTYKLICVDDIFTFDIRLVICNQIIAQLKNIHQGSSFVHSYLQYTLKKACISSINIFE